MKFRRPDIPELIDDPVEHSQVVADACGVSEISLPTDPKLWDHVDEVRASITMPDGFASDGVFKTIECRITLDTETEGFDEADGYWCSALVSPRAGNIWSGQREFRMPAECFYTRAIPDGWHSIDRVTLSVPDGCTIGEVALVTRQRVEGPRMTDDALISAFDPDVTGKSRPGALKKIVDHMRQSTRSRELRRVFSPPITDRSVADEVLVGKIMGHDWSEGIDWYANPTGYIEWSIRVHYMSYLVPVIDAWRETRDVKYARKLEEIVADWIRKNPVPYGMRGCGLAWGHSLVVANRGFVVLVDAFDVLRQCPEVADQTIVDVLKSIWEHAEYLRAFESFPPSNKTIAEGRTLGALGCAFPEFVDASSWRSVAYDRLLEDMRIQVFPDGASYELTPGYQMAIASWFLESFETARRFDHPVAEEFEAGIRSMYRWSAAIARPDFSRPSVSDAGSLNTVYGEGLAEPARILDEPEALWVGTCGKEGREPEYASIAMRDSGYFVMRSGWDRDARYLLFEGGPFGRFHQHEDMLSIDVYAYGTPFIVDPGISSYFPDPWTNWYRTSGAHNTVLIDGRGQSRKSTESVDEWTASVRDRATYESTDAYDVASACYRGSYEGVEERVTHARTVVFMRPDYFLVFDEVAGEGSHICETLFHFMPFRVVVDEHSGAVRTGRISEPNIEVIPMVRSIPKLVCGQNDPVQGWVSIDRQDVPAPVAIFSGEGELPQRAGYLIVPFGGDRVAAGAKIELDAQGDAWQVRISLPGRSDSVRVEWADTPRVQVSPS